MSILHTTPGKVLTLLQIHEAAKRAGYETRALRTIINVESPGYGFDKDTGKILIQFEPHWFKRKYTDWKKNQGVWVFNGIQNQEKEWIAFSDAYSKDADAAMESTSIGMGQVMGFHYKLLGFKTVGEMWDYAKESEANQLDLMIRFIKANRMLDKALKSKDWHLVAYYYNGSGYKELARKNKSTPYNIKLENMYKALPPDKISMAA